MNNATDRPRVDGPVYLSKPSVHGRHVPRKAGRRSRKSFAILAVAGSACAMAVALAIALAGGAPDAASSGVSAADASGGMMDRRQDLPHGVETAMPSETARSPRAASANAAERTVRTPVPASDDPRWNAADTAQAAQAEARTQKARRIAEALRESVQSDGAARADAPPEASDRFVTAAIDPASAETSVAVAESEAEIAALEAEMNAPAAAEPAAGGLERPEAFEAPMRHAAVSEHVNMRLGPDNTAGVITVVPKDARVQVSAQCQGWCAVIHDGRRGWIYKDYIRVSAQNAETAPAAPEPAKPAANAEPARAEHDLIRDPMAIVRQSR